jgi:hypothetical protein
MSQKKPKPVRKRLDPEVAARSRWEGALIPADSTTLFGAGRASRSLPHRSRTIPELRNPFDEAVSSCLRQDQSNCRFSRISNVTGEIHTRL